MRHFFRTLIHAQELNDYNFEFPSIFKDDFDDIIRRCSGNVKPEYVDYSLKTY